MNNVNTWKILICNINRASFLYKFAMYPTKKPHNAETHPLYEIRYPRVTGDTSNVSFITNEKLLLNNITENPIQNFMKNKSQRFFQSME